MNQVYKDMEDAAEGFWNKHKYCLVGGAVLLAAGFALGLLV